MYHENDDLSTSKQIQRNFGGKIQFIDAIQGTIASYMTSDFGPSSYQQIISTGKEEVLTNMQTFRLTTNFYDNSGMNTINTSLY